MKVAPRFSQWLAHFSLLALVLLTIRTTLAQAQTLETLTPVSGEITAGESQSWTFTATAGEVLSFSVQTEGDLDPTFSINGTSGKLIENDDYDYPNSKDALLEAITIPRTGTYTVVVSGANQTSGEYTLTKLPGYSHIEYNENFNGEIDWETSNEGLVSDIVDGQLTLSVEGARQVGISADLSTNAPTTYYAQVDINVQSSGNWIVGMTARQTSPDNYYLASINAQGQWRFSLRQADSERVIRDWTPHPAISPGRGTFTLGILVNGHGFDFFYDGQLIGRLTDRTLAQEGGFGLVVETLNSPTSQTSAAFDNLVITTPAEIDGERVIPQQLLIGTPTDMALELQRRGLIPAGGEMALTVNESFVESRMPGVEELRLGRGVTYQDFALGATVTWQAQTSGMTGCGLVLRAVDTTRYTLAYLDQMGGYGVSQREGDSFLPGIFGEKPTLNGNQHHLLVVARGDNLVYYTNGTYSGMLENPAVEGEIGNAVVNFEPISTSCQFTQTWLWRWDSSS
jgi:hypothetical protein